ncbi:hypothetical protein Syun_004590 [Stephania yunnanensis]|uniref:Uncharacterized protein n=1 Tax=Stephania yunnanensis TaxID=152371 RepID=A0AAP0Q1D8_9MAGN
MLIINIWQFRRLLTLLTSCCDMITKKGRLLRKQCGNFVLIHIGPIGKDENEESAHCATKSSLHFRARLKLHGPRTLYVRDSIAGSVIKGILGIRN